MTALCTLWTGLPQERLPPVRHLQPHVILCMAVMLVQRQCYTVCQLLWGLC